MSKHKAYTLDLDGLKQVFDALYPSLCLFACKYLEDMDTSKDVVQEVFIKIWERTPKFKSPNATKGYFYNAVKNRCLDYLKSKHVRAFGYAAPEHLAQIQSEDYFLSQVVTVETYDQLYRAIGGLQGKTAKVIQLSLNGYSTNDIAEELSITPSTVRTQRSVAFKKLRAALGNLNQFPFGI